MDRMTCCAQCQRHLMSYSIIGGRTELHCPVCEGPATVSSPSVIPGAAYISLPIVTPGAPSEKVKNTLPPAA